MEYVGSASGEAFITQIRRRRIYDDTREFKSKNLKAERTRRQKLNDRLLTLRSLVPIITNMNKATIVEDAITYIEKLQTTVKAFSDKLLEMESSMEVEEVGIPRIEEIDAAEEMKKHGIEEDVEVTNIDGSKLWIRIIFEKKRGRITKFLEAMANRGFELSDTCVTTSKGATLISSCVKGIYSYRLEEEQVKESLQEIIRDISTNPVHLKAVKGAEMWMVSLMKTPVASPAPSEVGIISESLRIRKMGKHHHFIDNSLAGGDAILGVFITAIVAAIVCCIPANRNSKIS